MTNFSISGEVLTWFTNTTFPYSFTETTKLNSLPSSELGGISEIVFPSTERWILTNETTSLSKNLDSHIEEDPIWFYPLLYAISAIGIALNLVFLFTVARVPSFSTTTNYYLVNLAIADINVLYILYVQTAVLHLVGSQSIFVYGLMIIIRNTFSFVSAFTISAVTVERFFAIYWPFKHLQFVSKARTIKLIIALWLFSLACAIAGVPLFVSKNSYLVETTLFVLFLFPFFVSLTVTLIFYPLIVLKVVLTSRKSTSENAPQTERAQVIRLLVITAVLYLVCIMPPVVYYMIWKIGVYESHTVFLVGRLLLFINSSINMLIYNAASASYRRGLVVAFKFKSNTEIRKSLMASQIQLATRHSHSLSAKDSNGSLSF